MHRAELVDLDQLVVEAVALLPEQHRARASSSLIASAVAPSPAKAAIRASEPTILSNASLITTIPVGDRFVDNVEHRQLADIGIGARPEAQAVGVRRETDVDRQHPQLAQHRENALLGGDGQREDHQIDARVCARTRRDRRPSRAWGSPRPSRASARRRDRRRRRECGFRRNRPLADRAASSPPISPPPTTTVRR